MDAESIHSAASHRSHGSKQQYHPHYPQNPHPHHHQMMPNNTNNVNYNIQPHQAPYNPPIPQQTTTNYNGYTTVSSPPQQSANYVYPIPPNNNGGYIPVSVLQNNGYATSNTIVPQQIPNNSNNSHNNAMSSTGEKIQVQILPQDDNWGIETSTAITSETGSNEDLSNFDKIITTGLCNSNITSSMTNNNTNALTVNGNQFPTTNGTMDGEDKLSMLPCCFNPNQTTPMLSCKQTCGNICLILLSIIGVFSPVVMVITPQLLPTLLGNWRTNQICGPGCEGQLLGLACKLLVLAGGTWAVFFRQRRPLINQPRICKFRLLILLLAILILISFWLLFCLRIIRYSTNSDSSSSSQQVDFMGIVQFANSLADSLILVHYLAIVLLEVQRLRMRFYVRVVRSPDGENQTYEVGLLTVQQVAAFVLQKYVADFSDYNVELVQCLQKRFTKRHGNRSSNSQSNNSKQSFDTSSKTSDKPKYKIYKIDSVSPNDDNNDSSELLIGEQSIKKPGKPSSTTSSLTNHNASNGNNNNNSTSARLYEENEWDKKFRKRQMRLLVAVEEALSHVRPSNQDENANVSPNQQNPQQQQQQQISSISAYEAAQTLLPAVMKPLQKLLRASKRQLAFTSTTVTNILAQCLNYRLSAKFMVQLLTPNLTILDSIKLTNPALKLLKLNWYCISQTNLSSVIHDGLIFQLKPSNCKIDDLSLICTIHSIPLFNLTEQRFDPNTTRFVLQTNSETSV